LNPRFDQGNEEGNTIRQREGYTSALPRLYLRSGAHWGLVGAINRQNWTNTNKEQVALTLLRMRGIRLRRQT
jgi:hypothetical protein